MEVVSTRGVMSTGFGTPGFPTLGVSMAGAGGPGIVDGVAAGTGAGFSATGVSAGFVSVAAGFVGAVSLDPQPGAPIK